MPAQLVLHPGHVDGIAPIMPRTVRDKADQAAERLCGFAGQVGQDLTDHVHHIEVLPVITPTNIVGLAHPSTTDHRVDGRAVIVDVEPVAPVRPIAVDRDRHTLETRTDNGGDKLLIMLIGAVVIGTVGHTGGEPVGLVVRPY